MKKMAAAVMTGMLALGLFTGCGGSKDIGKDEAKRIAFADAGVEEAEVSRLRVAQDRDDGRKTYEVQFDLGQVEYDYEIQASDGVILSAETDRQEASIQPQTADPNAAAAGTGTADPNAAAAGTGTADPNAAAAGTGTADPNAAAAGTGTADPNAAAAGTGTADPNAAAAGTGTADPNAAAAGTVAANPNAAAGNGTTASSVQTGISEADARAAALGRVPGASDRDLRMKLDLDDGRYIYEGDIIYDGKEYEFEIDANTGTFLEWSEERY